MPQLLSTANSRVRRMMLFESVLKTLATAMSIVISENRNTKRYTMSKIRRVVSSSSFMLLYVVPPIPSMGSLRTSSIAVSISVEPEPSVKL